MLEARKPVGLLYRISRAKNPWEFTDWAKAWKDPSGSTTFGNRFDDFDAEYRVLYASSQLKSCYIETLARFRRDPTLQAELNAIEGEDDYHPLGLVPATWFESRFVGTAYVEGKFANIYSAGWVAHLRPHLQLVCSHLGLPTFDVNSLMQAENREVTQRASRIIFDLANYSGIYYQSRHGLNLENWALFEGRAGVSPVETSPVSREDPELHEALALLQLEIPGSLASPQTLRESYLSQLFRSALLAYRRYFRCLW